MLCSQFNETLLIAGMLQELCAVVMKTLYETSPKGTE